VAGQDFNAPSPPEVTFSSGDVTGSTACATYVIIDDDNLEFDHEFTVSLSTVTPTGPVFNSSTTIVTITDDEGMHTVMLTFLIFVDITSIDVSYLASCIRETMALHAIG